MAIVVDKDEFDQDKLGDSNVINSLDSFMENTQPMGSIDKAIGNALYGINHRKVKGILPENKDDQGYTFFTRPQLNMSTKNLENYRHFYSLLTTRERSIHRYVRCMLDPRINLGNGVETITTPLLNPKSAFIPVLTNTLKSISGWPDVVNSSHISKAGVRKEQHAMVDGTVDIYEAFDLDVTFNNMREEPLSLLFDTWLHYMSNVFEGVLMPYMDFITENEIDYNTRIYRIVLTENKKYVKKIAATGASYPINIPTGKFFDASDERPFSDQTKDVTIRFKSLGAMYNDDILVKEFNATVGIFNPDMRQLNNEIQNMITAGIFHIDPENAETILESVGSKYGLEKIPDKLLVRLNNRGYPRINPMSFEFEWWADKEDIEYANKNIDMQILK